jgi:2-phospho-L-lactate guanylyltransferase
MSVALVVPVKSFMVAKGRLAGSLSPAERESLARNCATTVVRAASPWPVYVVCETDDISTWAHAVGARVVRANGMGLNEAIADGVHAVRADGFSHVVVAHGDLPLAQSFAHLVHADAVDIVPDRHRDGTNVLSFPTDFEFPTSYGAKSFDAHCRTIHQRGWTLHVVSDDNLSLDLDTVDDLDELHRRTSVEEHS